METGVQMPTEDDRLRRELEYQKEGYEQTISLTKWKIEQLVKEVSIKFAERIKANECMFTRECYEVYLKTLREVIVASDSDVNFLEPTVEEIRQKVLGEKR